MPAFNICDLYQNNDYSLAFQANDSFGNPIDLTDYTLTGVISNSYGCPNGIAFFSGYIPTPISGICQVSLNYSQTSGLKPNTYIYWIRAINLFTPGQFNLLEGYLTVNP